MPNLPTVSQKKEFNLAQNPQAMAERLEKMRKKLAAGPAEPSIKPESAGAIRRRRSTKRTYAGLILAGGVLAGINFMAHSHKDLILEAVGAQVIIKPLSPPPGLEQDELARFWAYAAFDTAKLKSHFTIPKNALIDPVDARHHVEDLLMRGAMGKEARAEVATLLKTGTEGRPE